MSRPLCLRNIPDSEHVAPTNRERRQRPKSGFFWCSKCDRDMVCQSGHCQTCGNKEWGPKFHLKRYWKSKQL